ncbi:UDP-N-acetylmuramoyl-L-alanine--D-glutamate ligase [Candidatus Kaiserbacteria bacterium]|nr:UDP-N-acetylmuramoyl-L-alanine--D-glutamate ligase [Candidatus Kaiserbacteria bacterium]
MNFKDYFKDKKVTVMGLGLLGRGIGDAEYIAAAGAKEVIVTDLKSEEQLKESVEKLKDCNNITFVLGQHRIEDFENRDLILVAAGVPTNSEFLRHASEAGVPQKQSAALFAELSQVPVIGVTGTRGKSTVTHMIHHVISELTGEPVLLGGNVRGVSNLQLLNEVKEDSLCVMELDSWQLQGWGWSKMSPQVAVFTNFMEDHLNYYQVGGKEKNEAMDLYFADKANIFRYQEESGVLVTTPEVFERAKKLEGVTLGQEVVLVDGSAMPEDTLLAMPGEHNRLNAALAYEALKALGLEDEEIFSGLASFPGVPGRLEYLGERDDVKIYNDNNATTPQATVVGLRAVGNADEKNVILIAGGAFKEVGPQVLIDEIPKYCKKVILLAGSGTDMMKDKVEAEVVESVEEAVKAGLACGQPGDIILFSPGFASFGMFKNEYERNDAFVAAVRESD